MKINYYNDVTREYGQIDETRATGAFRGKKIIFCARFGELCTLCDTFEDAHRIMTEHGYEKMGVIDESGCMRYTMTLPELQGLYKKMEDFVADCTQQEYNENKSAIIAVYTLIKKHIDAEIKK